MRMRLNERIIINDKSRITNKKVVREWMQNDDWRKMDSIEREYMVNNGWTWIDNNEKEWIDDNKK